MTHAWTVVVLVGLVGCAKPPAAEPVAASTPAAPVATREGTVATVDAPAATASPRPTDCAEPTCWASLEQRLRARHDEDLPDRAALDLLPRSDEGLAWLAQHADTLLVRARALDLVGLYGGDSQRALLIAVLDDAAAHGALRRAAVLGLARFDLATDASSRAALVARLADADVGVALESAGVLASVPAASAEIDARVAAGGVVLEVLARLGR